MFLSQYGNKMLLNKLKIFVLYHAKSIIYKTDILEPLHTGGASNPCKLGFLVDSSGDEISGKNKAYAELTGNYWVWKNYLPEHPELEYVGFCHYRRFLDFENEETRDAFSTMLKHRVFKREHLGSYNEKNVYPLIKDFDVILPKRISFQESIYNQFVRAHPKKEIDKLIEIIKNHYPDYMEDVDNAIFNTNEMYTCLNYLMKIELFEEWMIWIFDILQKLENESDWSIYRDTQTEKVAAYLAERFFNVWLLHMRRTENIKISERKSLQLLYPERKIKLPLGIGQVTLTNQKFIISFFGIKISKKRQTSLAK